jgi:hypothetical protein
MAIDLEAIKKRVAELSGVKKTSSVQMWKPGLGEHKIRCLPWKNSPDGQPFAERWFYYIGENSGIYINGEMMKVDEDFLDMINKLQQFYQKFKSKWGKVLSSRKKTKESPE